jgi:hypothetical protein
MYQKFHHDKQNILPIYSGPPAFGFFSVVRFNVNM